jgi:hypothetical protein
MIAHALQRPLRRVLSFKQWCEVNGFSAATGRRILQSGSGPKVTQLSPNRIGIREDHNAEWQETRIRGARVGKQVPGLVAAT